MLGFRNLFDQFLSDARYACTDDDRLAGVVCICLCKCLGRKHQPDRVEDRGFPCIVLTNQWGEITQRQKHLIARAEVLDVDFAQRVQGGTSLCAVGMASQRSWCVAMRHYLGR